MKTDSKKKKKSEVRESKPLAPSPSTPISTLVKGVIKGVATKVVSDAFNYRVSKKSSKKK